MTQKKKAELRMFSEPDRVVVVAGDSGLSGEFIVSPPRCAHSK